MNDQEKKQFLNFIRLRIVNVFKKWLLFYRPDFEDPELKAKKDKFIDGLLSDPTQADLVAWAGFLQQIWESATSARLCTEESKMASGALKKLQATPIDKLTFLLFDITEFSRQVVMKRQQICANVRPIHLLDWARGKENEQNPIRQLNDFSSQMQDWVITEICKQTDLKQRTKCLSNFVKLVFKMLELNDFCGAADVYVALSGYLITRLKKTRKGLDTKTEEKFKSLDDLMSPTGSWKALRVKMASAKAPYTIPSAIVMRDLITINENDDWWDESKEMINFHKRRLLATVIFQFQEATREGYPFSELKIIQQYLSNLVTLPVEELEDLTRVLEPVSTKK